MKYNAVLDVEHLDELEARSGPSAKRRLSMHSSADAVSEGGDSLDSLSSLQDFQGSASDEEEEEGAASGEEKEYTLRDVAVMVKNNIAIMAEMQANMGRTVKEWPPR